MGENRYITVARDGIHVRHLLAIDRAITPAARGLR